MMAAVKEKYLSYGSNMGLARQLCGECNGETLHRHGRCIHCGTEFVAVRRPDAKTPAQQYKDGLQIRRRRA